ncbi:C40 family peptidase [Streptosporangium soli]|nr:C40 family peptidase [Streptosporangium sp. KLBMP 9127]
MNTLRRLRRARLSIGGAALTLTASAGVVTLQSTAVEAATSTAPSPSTVSPDTSTLTELIISGPTTTSTNTPAKAERSAATGTKAVTKTSKTARQQAKAGKAVSAAKKQIGDPYRWGGTGPNGFDCSGLVQYSWKKAGVKLPRVTHSQYARIKTKISFEKLRPGDLMFFSGKGHVGMYVGKGKMIHSPSSGKTVRIEKLSGWRKASFSGAVRPGI